jgi:hypothetical protein
MTKTKNLQFKLTLIFLFVTIFSIFTNNHGANNLIHDLQTSVLQTQSAFASGDPDPVTAIPDSITIDQGETGQINALLNDIGSSTLSYCPNSIMLTSPNLGTVSVQGNIISITPISTFTGDLQILYRACDTVNTQSNESYIDVRVNPVLEPANLNPLLEGQTINGSRGIEINFPNLVFSDPDNNLPLTLEVVNCPSAVFENCQIIGETLKVQVNSNYSGNEAILKMIVKDSKNAMSPEAEFKIILPELNFSTSSSLISSMANSSIQTFSSQSFSSNSSQSISSVFSIISKSQTNSSQNQILTRTGYIQIFNILTFVVLSLMLINANRIKKLFYKIKHRFFD